MRHLLGLAVFVAVLNLFPGAATALISVGALETPGSAHDVEVVGGLAYVADGGSGLRIIDVSNPQAPVELGAIETSENARDVEVVGHLAYVADVGRRPSPPNPIGVPGSLRIIDVSKPAAPVEPGALVTPPRICGGRRGG